MAHKILVTSPEAKYLCYLFGAFLGFGLWTGTWPRACQLLLLYLMVLSLQQESSVTNMIHCVGRHIFPSKVKLSSFLCGDLEILRFISHLCVFLSRPTFQGWRGASSQSPRWTLQNSGRLRSFYKVYFHGQNTVPVSVQCTLNN